MDFYKKAKAQMKELQGNFLQQEFGGETAIGVEEVEQDLAKKLHFHGFGTRGHAPTSASTSVSSAPTGSSYAGTPADSRAGTFSATVSTYMETPSSSSVATSTTSYTPNPATPTSTADLSVIPNDAAGAPAPKLPLTARKSVRDDFESKKDELIGRLSNAMQTPWIIHADVNAIYTYAIEDRTQARDNPGRMLYSYFEHAVGSVENYVKKFGEDGRTQLNKLASSHTMTLEPALHDELKNTSKNPSGCDIKDSKLRLLFAKSRLGQNTSIAAANLGEAVSLAGAAGETVSGAGGPALNLVARNGIRNVYEAQVGKLLAELRTILAAPTFELVPNFEANYAAVRTYVDAQGDRNVGGDWDAKLGDTTLKYFNGLKGQLERQKFPGDAMLQEGFQDAVEKNEVQLRVVSKLAKKKFNECVIEGGVLYTQVVPECWRMNVNDAGEGLINML